MYKIIQSNSKIIFNNKKKSVGSNHQSDAYTNRKTGSATLCNNARNVGIPPEKALTEIAFLMVLTLLDDENYKNELIQKEFNQKSGKNTIFEKTGLKRHG